MESRSYWLQNVVYLVTKSPCVSPNNEHSDTLGTVQNADEQYVQQLSKEMR